MRRLIIRPQAELDIRRTTLHIAKDNLEASDAFLAAVMRAIETLAENPGLGQIAGFMRRENQALRRWPTPKFVKSLIFYRPLSDGIEVVRVLHSARNIPRLFHEKGDRP